MAAPFTPLRPTLLIGAQVSPSGPNATTISKIGKLQRGYMRTISPVVTSAASIPRGRYYVEHHLMANGDAATYQQSDDLGILWSGYVTSDGTKGSQAVSLLGGMFTNGTEGVAVFVFSGSSGVATDAFGVMVTYQESAGGGVQLNAELPFTGPGELRKFSTAVPAAGAIQAAHVFGAGIRVRVRSVYMTNTLAGAGNRQATWTYINKDNGVLGIYPNEVYSGAALNVVDLSWASAGGVSQMLFGTSGVPAPNDTGASATSAVGFSVGPVPDVIIAGDGANAKMQFYHPGIQATDQLSAANVLTEEWAGPAP